MFVFLFTLLHYYFITLFVYLFWLNNNNSVKLINLNRLKVTKIIELSELPKLRALTHTHTYTHTILWYIYILHRNNYACSGIKYFQTVGQRLIRTLGLSNIGAFESSIIVYIYVKSMWYLFILSIWTKFWIFQNSNNEK